MHRLLARQIRRHLGDEAAPRSDFLAAVEQAYQQYEDELKLLERSLELASTELRDRNLELRDQVETLQLTRDKLAEEVSLINTTFDSIGEGILVLNLEGRVVRSNEQVEKAMGVERKDLIGIDLAGLMQIATEQLTESDALRTELRRTEENPAYVSYCQIESKKGRLYEFYSQPVRRSGSVSGRVCCFRDVTEVRQHEEILKHQAYHDSLTRLPNRLLFNDRLTHALQLAERRKKKLALLFLDLDNFKNVNDSMGHEVGDKLLVEVASRLLKKLRHEDTLARLGGDEFVVLLEDVEDEHYVRGVAQRIIDELAKPFVLGTEVRHVSASVGITRFPDDALDAQSLVRKADMAMYSAKSRGKNNFQYFDGQLEDVALNKIALENRLREAISKSQLFLCYQPKVDARTLAVVGLEALLRWKVDGELIFPDQFIPVAEQTGLIIPIGEWVIHEACAFASRLRSRGWDISVSVNLSQRQLRDDRLLRVVREALASHDLPGSALELEITESMLMENVVEVTNTLHQLNALGVSLSIDDFGTGYSSLSYLIRLPIQALKIDKCFIRDLPKSKDCASIASSVIQLAHNLNLRVIAEGVEDRDSVDFLATKSCDQLQGFHFCRPIIESEVVDWIENGLANGADVRRAS